MYLISSLYTEGAKHFAGVCTDRLTEKASFITGIGDQTLVFISICLIRHNNETEGTNWMVSNEWWKGER